jgi:nicotinamide riboside transporter PnuC
MVDAIIHQFTQYYGSDWVATVATVFWLIYIGDKKRSSFIYAVIASFSWMIFGWLNNSVASVCANILFILLNIRGYYKWAPEKT